tara:strand:+ start:624 stop:1739 length:1116 start_codon:yes stop_codon:yes gene_type:complete
VKKIGIIGAGVSGLTLACLLKKNTNYDITIFEKDNLKFKNINGIQISPNAFRILRELNFDSFDQSRLCKISGVSFHDYSSNKKIATMNFNLNDQSYIALNRSDLINFLINKFSLKDQIIDKEVIKIHEKSILLKDEKKQDFDILVVADGIFSNLRNKKIEPIYSGYSAFRGVFSDERQTNNIDLWMGKNFHFVKYPIDQNKNHSFTLVKKIPYNKDILSYDYEIKNLKENKKFYFPNLNNISFKDLNIKMWPIYKLNKVFYGDKDTFFIGDSAHGFIPSRAQGAAQAIEDSHELFNLIATNDISPRKLFKIRKNRIKKIKRKSENNIIIFHLNFFILRKIRNLLIKVICSSKFLVKYINSYIFDYKYKKNL